jgi:hypothetical protein
MLRSAADAAYLSKLVSSAACTQHRCLRAPPEIRKHASELALFPLMIFLRMACSVQSPEYKQASQKCFAAFASLDVFERKH